MAVKNLTILIDLTKVAVARRPNAVTEEDIAFNRGIALHKKLVVASVVEQCKVLRLLHYVGRDAILVRGREEAMLKLNIPDECDWREASERWQPYRG